MSFRIFVEEAFESRFLDLPPDHRMHYIDEGEGEPIVFVHGNPAWSFEFRHPVRELRSEFRCVALDHLDLRDITLFMNDWGGPLGLDFARRRPERVKRLVIANTWCWPVGDDFHFRSSAS